MAAVGWVAFGTLCTKVLAVASNWIDVQDYTVLAIAVCASSTALIALSGRHRMVEAANYDAVALRSMADQMLFPENRRRLLALAQRLEIRRNPSEWRYSRG